MSYRDLKLLRKLRQEHRDMVHALDRLARLRPGSGEYYEFLVRTRELISQHLAAEAEWIYPALESGGSEAALRCYDQMLDVSGEVLEFLEYALKLDADYESFAYACRLGRIKSLLQHRINREEEVLYPEFEAIRSEVISVSVGGRVSHG